MRQILNWVWRFCITHHSRGKDILWEDDGKEKDDSDWVTDDSVMSDDGESDE
jgi:hypothetical protein